MTKGAVLPEGVIAVNVWMNGHGPAPADKQTWGDVAFTPYGVCDVPTCLKCIRGYKRAVNFPRGKAEEEVFA